MKLLRVKILGEKFRSLPANIDYNFNETLIENKLSTKVFAGLNGSGKSNFLELIAEIFFSLERYILNESKNKILEVQRLELLKELSKYNSERHPKKYENISKKIDEVKKKIFFDRDFNFEIEYLLNISEDILRELNLPPLIEDNLNLFKPHEDTYKIIITKKFDELPEYAFQELHNDSKYRIDTNFNKFLPTNIIAYTSGQNELLSNPFIRLRYHYFNELQNTNNNLYKRRMYFIDEESNYSIFIANMLLGHQKPLEYLKSIFSIEDLFSFRITINYRNNTKEALSIFNNKLTLLEPLKACATSWQDDTYKKMIVLDFVVNEATHEAFKYYYSSAFQLFQTFYELQSLNLLIDKQEVRKFVVNASKVLNLSNELSKPDPSDFVFRIEKIRIKKIKQKKCSEELKKTETTTIFYKALSDGEHQLNEVIGSVMMMENEGSLFLMDEPDTHFNPKWRAKMVTMLNQVSGNEYDHQGKPERIRQHEIIMTTHSPFIISDNQKEDVYKFERVNKSIFNEQGKEIDCDELLKLKNPEYQTYGSSVGFVLETIFDRDLTISDYSNEELNNLKESLTRLDDVKRVKKELLKFGESIEKFDAYNYLMIKEKELKSEKDAK
ncbi:restriction system-associated AAA family ATPase [Sphingobacterium sp. WOUb80]|uniref:restriction system-associated AAA family ATPase n=1 Tax=Sphingobacterium sp. WOUb80 TaxID=3234028 RepID=UPI003CE849ED